MKKTILSFLCIGSTCMLLAQQQPRQSTDPNQNRTPNQLNTTQQPPQNNTLNGNTQPTHPNAHQAIPNNPNVNNNQVQPANPNPNMNNNTVTPAPVTNENRNTIGNTPPDNNYNTGTPMNNAATTTTYSVTVPTSVETSFKASYPMAGTVTWRQSGDWYSARYRDENGKLMEASYREDGKSFVREASPLLRTYVPEEAVNKAIDMYGANIYAIALVKGSEGDMYNVTVIENGQSKTMWMNADGSTVMNPYRTETTEQTNNMNNTAEPVNTDEVTDPQAAPADTSSTPADNGTQDNNDMMNTGDDEQPVIEEGQTSELDESGRLNKEGINNGKSSEEVQPEEE